MCTVVQCLTYVSSLAYIIQTRKRLKQMLLIMTKTKCKFSGKALFQAASSVQIKMVSMHSEKAQMCSKPSLRSFPNIAFETVLSYKTALKQQLNSEKWNVGYASSVQIKMVSMHSEKAQMCSKPSLRSFPNIAFETVLSYKTALKQQLNSEKWNVGYVSAFCWTVLLCCFSIQCFCRCFFSPMHFWCLCTLHLTPHFSLQICREAGNKCVTTTDGYFILTAVCFLFGLVWLVWRRNKLRQLDSLPESAWKCTWITHLASLNIWFKAHTPKNNVWCVDYVIAQCTSFQTHCHWYSSAVTDRQVSLRTRGSFHKYVTKLVYVVLILWQLCLLCHFTWIYIWFQSLQYTLVEGTKWCFTCCWFLYTWKFSNQNIKMFDASSSLSLSSLSLSLVCKLYGIILFVFCLFLWKNLNATKMTASVLKQDPNT